MKKFAKIEDGSVSQIATAEWLGWCLINIGPGTWVEAPDDIESKEYTWDITQLIFVEKTA
jgi:hypothetical protein